MKGSSKKVKDFMRSLNGYEYGYLTLLVDWSGTIQSVIKKYKISEEEFCQAVGIKKERYSDYVCGAYNYSIKDMVRVENLNREKEKELAAKSKLINVGVK